jgi:hypothetical protein
MSTCIGGTGKGGKGNISRFPNRGGVARVMNSQVHGSLSLACRSAAKDDDALRNWRGGDIPSLASSSRIGGAPIGVPISKITRAGPTRVAQNSKPPFPFPIRVSLPWGHKVLRLCHGDNSKSICIPSHTRVRRERA